MNQISPIGSNPFHMFNVSPAIAQSQANVQMTDNTANVQPPMPQSAAPTPAVSNVQNNSVSQNAQNQTTQQSDVNSSAKKISTKTVAAAGAALAAVAGIVYAVKKHKVKEIPVQLTKMGNEAQEAATNAQSTMAKVQDGIIDAAQDVADDAAITAQKTFSAASQATPQAAQTIVQENPAVKDAAKEAQEAAKKLSDATLEETKESFKDKILKNGEINFALAAFGIGLIARSFRELKNSDDVEAMKLKKEVLNKEPYLKEVEIPYVLEEASEAYLNYNTSILGAIEHSYNSVEKLYDIYNEGVELYNSLDKDTHSEFWEGTNTIKYDIERKSNGTVSLVKYDAQGNIDSKILYNAYGRPLQVSKYSNNKLVAKGRFVFSQQTQEPYMSNLFIFPKGSTKSSHMLIYDENQKPLYYLARTNEGDRKKAFQIDAETSNVEAALLPDENGKKWLKKYYYTNDGEIDKIIVMPSYDLPMRRYNFEDGKLQSLDLFDDEGSAPVLHVPFEDIPEINQDPEFIEK